MSDVPMTACWALPLTSENAVAGPGVAVAVNVTGDPEAPLSVAVAVWVPAVCPSVQVAVAVPEASVMPGFVMLATAPTATQVTVSPCFGVPPTVTSTRSGFGSTVATVAVCASPLAVAAFWITGPELPGLLVLLHAVASVPTRAMTSTAPMVNVL